MAVPLPKSQTHHPARACAPLPLPHMLSWLDKTSQTPPPVCSFSCACEVAQSLHENNMSGANVQRRFSEILGEGKDFVTTFYVKKPVCEREFSATVLGRICKQWFSQLNRLIKKEEIKWGDKLKLFILFVSLFTLSLLSKIVCSLCRHRTHLNCTKGMLKKWQMDCTGTYPVASNVK